VQHDLECLAKIASLIGEADLEQKILEFAASSENKENFLSFNPGDNWMIFKNEGNEHYKNSRLYDILGRIFSGFLH